MDNKGESTQALESLNKSLQGLEADSITNQKSVHSYADKNDARS